jgi:hypothetical protein
MSALKRLSGYLLRFAGWSLLFALLYSLVTRDYMRLIVFLADVLTNLVVPVTMQAAYPGLVINSPLATSAIGAPYSLTGIGLNLIFAPALVLATVGLSKEAPWRVLVAILIMMGLHAIQITSIAMFYLSHPDNASIALGYSESTVTALGWAYRFIDRMSYALFPFVAWALVCLDRLGELFATAAPPPPPPST